MSSLEQEDIVTRLRDMSLDHEQVCEEAASEIVTLRRSLEELQRLVYPADEVPEPEPVPRKRKKAPNYPPGTPAKERLLTMIEVDPVSGCWVWLGSGSTHYGYIRNDKGFAVLAHRLSYELHTGYRFKKGEKALHSCDNTWCVNPDHIRPGTQRENAEDKSRRGRHHSAKVTLEQAQEIRRRYDDGETGSALAKEFGLTPKGVSHIITGRSWQYRDEANSGSPKRAKRGQERRSSLTPKDIRDIRKRHARGESTAAIAARYGISRGAVYRIRKKLRWRHVK